MSSALTELLTLLDNTVMNAWHHPWQQDWHHPWKDFNHQDEIKSIDRFLDKLSKLYFDYFCDHLSEIRTLDNKYVTAIAYFTDLLNHYYVDTKWEQIRDQNNYCDLWAFASDICYNIEAYNVLFQHIATVRADRIFEFSNLTSLASSKQYAQKPVDTSWFPYPKPTDKPQRTQHTIQIHYHTKLIELIQSIPDDNDEFDNFMSQLVELYYEYFQFHCNIIPEILKDAPLSLTKKWIHIEKKYIPKEENYLLSVIDCLEEELIYGITSPYDVSPWKIACEIRSNILAFNEMFSFITMLDDTVFREYLLCHVPDEKSPLSDAGKKPLTHPDRHWWWLV